MSRVHLSLLIHAHQPLGNFDHVLENVYRQAYQPFAESLARHPRIRMALHYSGVLLEWMEKAHPEHIDLLKELAARGQIEMLGGGYYEPVLSAIPERDRLAQIERLSDYLESRFGRRPRGLWLTERVWDPTLPATLARAGVQYTLTDDYHFLSVGLETDQLYGYYLTEWQRSVAKVIPGQKSLRYLLPFRMEHEAIDYLRQIAGRHPGALVAMGDDLEKFGGWPETHKHVYTDGWMRRFYEAIEQSGDWLITALPGDYLESNAPLGRIYLPTASYQEMMGWALPGCAGKQYEDLLHRVEQQPDGGSLSRFVHGGVWHNFFHKYEEANLLHKRMLGVSARYEDLDRATSPSGEARRAYHEGYEDLLRSQCNDAYWHGVFGGLYSPHLRTAVQQALCRAELAADRLDGAAGPARPADINVDGYDEVILSNDVLSVVLMTGDGGTAGEIAYRPLAFNVVNSLRRRPEVYHEKLRETRPGEQRSSGAVSIHDRVIVKEPHLDRYLQYDRYNRTAFRSMVFGAGRTIEEYRQGRLDESENLAGGPYQVLRADVQACELAAQDPHCLCEIRNSISIDGSTLLAEWSVSHRGLAELAAGLELVLNLLAPEAHDRYFVLPNAGESSRPPLRWAGEVRGGRIALVDEWLNLRIDLRVEPEARWWILPIYTVSQSEEGFEKVYQGSCLLPHWPLQNGELRAKVRLEFGSARRM